MSLRLMAVIAVVVVLAAACGADGGSGETTTSAAPTSTTATTSTTAATSTTTPTTTLPDTSTSEPQSDDLSEGSGCTPGPGDLPDGEWFGYVTAREEASIDFDLACWFSGEAAIQASAEDGEESPPPNDYYVRNSNPATRTLPVEPGIEVVFYPDGDPNHETIVSYADWAGLVAERGYELGVWLEIQEGVIEEITEKWVP